MPILVRKLEVYVYTIPLEHLELSVELICTSKRAYLSLNSSFVWDQPNVLEPSECIMLSHSPQEGRVGVEGSATRP